MIRIFILGCAAGWVTCLGGCSSSTDCAPAVAATTPPPAVAAATAPPVIGTAVPPPHGLGGKAAAVPSSP